MVMDQMDGPTPLQSARPMAFIAMAVKSECLLLINNLETCGHLGGPIVVICVYPKASLAIAP